MYTYYLLNPIHEVDSFFNNVELDCYGDDDVMGVSETIPWFHHTSISKILADIGVEYTMADKESESVPYISIKDVSYLKRKFVWDDDVGAILAPLEHDSIEKMLTMCTSSSSVCAEQQAMDVIGTAQREYFFYGKEIFHKKQEMFRSVVAECDLEPYVRPDHFPSWEFLKSQFWEASKGL